MQEFQLRVVPIDNNNFGLEIYQCAYKKAGEKKRPPAKRLGRLKGNVLILARPSIYQLLKQNNYDPKTLNHHRKKPYILDEKSVVTLAILFQALQPLRKSDKIVNIAAGIKEMSNEEAHYWFAKVNSSKNPAALKALRILLGE